ncbi:MAG: hypothetical protein HY569_03100 [Candidatus Magasanikbacteria bacterium]|nr:hypothetical protein [Candidatus Magasanikbacteria bacterium]
MYGKCEHLVEYEDCKDALGPDGYCYDDSFFPAKCQKYPYGNCDDSIACTVDFFSTVSQQCEHVPDCNDGDPDTIDVCDYQTGGCASGWGPCESDEDCDLNVAYLPSCKDGVWYVTGMKDRKCVDSICTYPFKAQTICPLGCDDGDPSFCNCESDADCPTNIFPHTSCQKVYDSDDNVYSLCWYDD